jgi:hypothetical protein
MSFPDAEALAVAFVRSQIAPVHAGTRVPADRPSSFVRVYRTGGAALNRVLEEAQITVDAEAASEAEAWALASACREAFLHRYTLMPLVRAATEISGLHSTPDPDTNTPRYRFTVALMVRAGR